MPNDDNKLPLNGKQQTTSSPPIIFTEEDALPPMPQENSGSAAPADDIVMPIITTSPTPKKKFAGGKIIATILGLFLLVGGIGAGVFLVNQNQNINEKADGNSYSCNTECGGCTTSCTVENFNWDGNQYIVPTGSYSIKTKCAGVNTMPRGCSCPQISDPWLEGSNSCLTPGIERYFVRGGPGKTNGWDSNYCGTQQVDITWGQSPLVWHSIANIDSSVCNQATTPPSVGVCAPTHYNCLSGVSNGGYTDNATLWTWNCNNTPCVEIMSTATTPPSVGVCAPTHYNCLSGVSNGGYTDNATLWTWNCNNTPCVEIMSTATAQCQNIKAYTETWTLLTNAQLALLHPTNKVNFCVTGSATGGSFDKARLTINGVLQTETITKRPGNDDYCQLYPIPGLVGGTPPVTTFNITAEIHHVTLGWK